MTFLTKINKLEWPDKRKLLCNDVLEWYVVYTYNTNDVTLSVLELIDLEHLVAQSAEYGLRFIA